MTDATNAAFADLRWLHRLAVRLARDSEDADDLVQDVAIDAWRDPPTDRDRSIRPWLATLLRNRWRMTRRANERRRARELVGDAVTPAVDEPDRAVARLEVLRVLLAELEKLPAEDRTLIVQRYFEERSAAEIARALDVPAATVRSRIQRTLKRLQRALDDRPGGRPAWSAAVLGVPVSLTDVPNTTATPSAVGPRFVAIATAVLGVLGLVLLGSRSVSTFAPIDTDDEAQAAPATSSTRAAWEERRDRIRDSLRLPAAGTSNVEETDVGARGENQHRVFGDLVKSCLLDLDSDASGALTLDIAMIGAPDIGTIYEDVEVVTTTFGDDEALQCVVQSMYAFVGDPPPEPFERRFRQSSTIGTPANEDARLQRVFDVIVGAHVAAVHFCEQEVLDGESVRGTVDIAMTFEGYGAPKAVEIVRTDLPAPLAECIVAKTRLWKFPESFSGRTFEYHFVVPSKAPPTPVE